MRRLLAILVLTGLSLSPNACGGRRQTSEQIAGAALLTQRAAAVLSYPHDEHVFGELPADLSSAPQASARLIRDDNQVQGTIETTMTPGHVGKLLAVVINNPMACEVSTPFSACGPHEEEFNVDADGGFYLGDGAVADSNGSITLSVTARVGATANVLCGGAANPDFDSCSNGFTLRDPRGAEVTLVLLDNGPASDDPDVRARQLASPSPCPRCPPYTWQVAVGFGREPPGR